MHPRQIQELIHDEGQRLKVYDDATGLPIGPGTVVIGHATIGIGRALDVNGISPQEAWQMFRRDVMGNQRKLGIMPWFLTIHPIRQGVIINLAFNMGVRGVLAFKRMIAALEAGDYDLAAAELLDSKWATQVQASRRDRLVNQLRTGQLDPPTEPAVPSPAPRPLPPAVAAAKLPVGV